MYLQEKLSFSHLVHLILHVHNSLTDPSCPELTEVIYCMTLSKILTTRDLSLPICKMEASWLNKFKYPLNFQILI